MGASPSLPTGDLTPLGLRVFSSASLLMTHTQNLQLRPLSSALDLHFQMPRDISRMSDGTSDSRCLHCVPNLTHTCLSSSFQVLRLSLDPQEPLTLSSTPHIYDSVSPPFYKILPAFTSSSATILALPTTLDFCRNLLTGLSASDFPHMVQNSQKDAVRPQVQRCQSTSVLLYPPQSKGESLECPTSLHSTHHAPTSLTPSPPTVLQAVSPC